MGKISYGSGVMSRGFLMWMYVNDVWFMWTYVEQVCTS